MTSEFNIGLKYLLNVGEARKLVKDILNDDVFDNLSKHNPYFDSEHDKEDQKLEDLRWALNRIQDALHKIWELIEAPEDDEDDQGK